MTYEEWLSTIEQLNTTNTNQDLLNKLKQEPVNNNLSSMIVPKLVTLINNRFEQSVNKIIKEENPEYIIVAFDKGKTFRHEEYEGYKDGRTETPKELKMQFPVAKQILTAMGIKYYEIEGFEADDIIGTFARYCDEEEDFIGTIISSDKDLLQLISKDVDIKLLKQKDYIRYNEETFKKEWGIDPINIIDLKALMGDASDNIPGVKE